jgi:hypothetical protein
MNDTTSTLGKDIRKLVLLPLNLVLAPLTLVAVACGKLTFREWCRLCVNSLPCVS